MKRKKERISGPGVRYYEHSAGIVNRKKPALIRIVLPMMATMLVLGGGGYLGLEYYHKPASVLQSSEVSSRAADIRDSERSDIDLQPFEAQEDEKLARNIKEEIDNMPKGTEWAVSVRDLNSSRMANINSGKKMEAASFYKMFLLAPLEKRLSSQYWSSYIGNQTISECVENMIAVSDNDCPVILGNYVGWDEIDLLNNELGFTNTTVKREGVNVNATTTSKDMSELMYRFQNSMILSDKARRLFFNGLYNQQYREGIPAGCGSGCLIGNKTGDLDNIKHDAAVVKHGAAHYIVVIMSSGETSWGQVSDLAGRIDKLMNP